MPKSNNKGKAEMNSTVGLDVPKSNEAPHTKFDHPPVQLSKHNYPRFMLGLYAWIGALPKGGADLRALVQHGLNPSDPNVEEGENVSGELSTRNAEIKTRYDRTMLTYNSLKATISALENRILDIQVEIDRDQVEAALKAQTARLSAAEPTTPPKRTRGTAAEAEPTQESLVRRAGLPFHAWRLPCRSNSRNAQKFWMNWMCSLRNYTAWNVNSAELMKTSNV